METRLRRSLKQHKIWSPSYRKEILKILNKVERYKRDTQEVTSFDQLEQFYSELKEAESSENTQFNFRTTARIKRCIKFIKATIENNSDIRSHENLIFKTQTDTENNQILSSDIFPIQKNTVTENNLCEIQINEETFDNSKNEENVSPSILPNITFENYLTNLLPPNQLNLHRNVETENQDSHRIDDQNEINEIVYGHQEQINLNKNSSDGDITPDIERINEIFVQKNTNQVEDANRSHSSIDENFKIENADLDNEEMCPIKCSLGKDCILYEKSTNSPLDLRINVEGKTQSDFRTNQKPDENSKLNFQFGNNERTSSPSKTKKKVRKCSVRNKIGISMKTASSSNHEILDYKRNVENPYTILQNENSTNEGKSLRSTKHLQEFSSDNEINEECRQTNLNENIAPVGVYSLKDSRLFSDKKLNCNHNIKNAFFYTQNNYPSESMPVLNELDSSLCNPENEENSSENLLERQLSVELKKLFIEKENNFNNSFENFNEDHYIDYLTNALSTEYQLNDEDLNNLAEFLQLNKNYLKFAIETVLSNNFNVQTNDDDNMISGNHNNDEDDDNISIIPSSQSPVRRRFINSQTSTTLTNKSKNSSKFDKEFSSNFFQSC